MKPHTFEIIQLALNKDYLMDTDEKKFKYLLIFDKNKSLFYGECIEWNTYEFDKRSDVDIEISLPGRYKARVITSPSRIDTIDTNKNAISFKDLNQFSYSKSGEGFITLGYHEKLFNPLIDRCSKITMYISDDGVRFDDNTWTQDNKALLDDIKSKFGIDLFNQPELINTYTLYIPTRITVNVGFTDKPARGETREPTNLKVSFIAEHQCYNSVRYKVVEYVNSEPIAEKTGCIADNSCTIDTGVFPDEVEVTLFNSNGETIYYSRHGFIKRINFNLDISSGSVALENGSKVTKYEQSSFSVGHD